MLSIIWEISSVDQFRTEEHPVRSMHWTMRRRSLPLRKVATSVYYTHRCISCCQQSCFLTNCCFSVQALLPSKSSFVFSLIKSVEIALHSILCSSMMITDQCGTHNAHTKHFQALVRLVLRRCMHWELTTVSALVWSVWELRKGDGRSARIVMRRRRTAIMKKEEGGDSETNSVQICLVQFKMS